MLTNTQQQKIVEKILKLPPEQVRELETFLALLLTKKQINSRSEEPLLSVAGVLSGEPLIAEAIDTELYAAE